MWTQAQIDEIVHALRHLPAEKLQEAERFVLSLKEQYGYDGPVDGSDDWTDEDLDDARAASWRRRPPTGVT